MIQLTENEAIEIYNGVLKTNLVDWIGYCKKLGWIARTALEIARDYRLSGGCDYVDIESVNHKITLYEKAIMELEDKLNDKYKMEKEFLSWNNYMVNLCK